MSAHGSHVGRYGRAVLNGDGLLHVERAPGETFCGQPFDSYMLHWDTRTVVACGVCLFEAGAKPAAVPGGEADK